MSITEVIDQLRTYNGPAKLTLHKGADESLLHLVESVWNIILPDDFKEFYRFSNGFETVEDIFNMIPLEEIIDNKTRDKSDPLYIAEYMIYSDMWYLEINPANCNDYKIIGVTQDNKLELTNSLAEFIQRFLTGGVFDTGGLYDWQEEVELQPIYSTKLKTTESLLTFFYHGLRNNLISKKEVVDWADGIVMRENEPEFFFIELSLCHDKNEMISLLHSKCVPDNHGMIARAILGLLYHRLNNGIINLADVMAIMDNYELFKQLTTGETDKIYFITEDIWPDELMVYYEDLTKRALHFLAYYKEFEISNFKYWPGYSYHIAHRVSEEEKKSNSIFTPPKKRLKITAFTIQMVVYSLAAISLIILVTNYIKIEDTIYLGKFRNDLYQLSQLYFFFFICYYALKAGEWLVKSWLRNLKNS